MDNTGADRGSLGHRSITAMLWGTGGSILRIALQVVSQIVLARILGPEAYGLFAIALVIVLFSSLFADVGLAYGLIQKPVVSRDDVRFVFTWQALLGIAMTAIVLLLAPVIARAYDDPRLLPALAMLSVSCLVNAAAATSGALLRRELDFKTLNIAAVASYAAGFLVVGIPMALAGAGVLALVSAYLVQTSVQGLIQYAVARHPVRPLLWQTEAPAMLTFGATVLATNLVNWAMNGVDRAIVGSALGLSAAGLYATAYNLIGTPLVTALALLQSVFYSASAKVQDEPEQMRRGLRTLFAGVALFVAPVFAGVAAAAETLMVALYGARWSGGGEVLAPLALAMPICLMMGLAVPVLWASGATRRELEIQVPIAALWVVVLWSVAKVGSLGVLSWAVLALFVVRAGLIVGATLLAVGLEWRAAWRACRPGVAVTLLVALAALVADRGLGPSLGLGIPLLLADVAAAGAAMLVGLRLVGKGLDPDLTHLLRQLAGRFPAGAGPKALRLLTGL